MNSMESLLKNVIKGGIFILPFLPFLVTDSLFFPFITGKTFVFRIVVELLLIAWVALALKNRAYLPKRSLLLWMLIVFFIVVGLSTAFSLSPYKSFWSNAERMEGMFGLLHVLALFVITAGVFKERDWVQFFFVSLVASVGVAIHGFGQIFGWYDTHQGTRVDANFGNSTYFAMYAVFMIFFSLMMAYRARLRMYIPFFEGKEKIAQWVFVILAAAFGILLYINSTRGALLGLFGGLFLTSLVIAVLGKGKVRRVSIGLFALFLVTPLLFLAVKNTSFVQESPTLKRFADISLTETTTESRLTIWGMAFDAWKGRPILGYGMENFTIIFARYYEPKLWKQEPWFDRTHNVPMDWLISAGILGLLTYLSLYVVTLYLLWKGYRQKTFNTVHAALLVGLLAAHFVHNLFVFDYLISYIFFFAVLAYIHVQTQTSSEKNGPLIAQALSRQFVVSIISLVLLASVYFYNIKPIQAAGSLLDGMRFLSSAQIGTENIEKAREAFTKTINYGTFITGEAREQLIINGTEVTQAELANREAIQDYTEYAFAQGEQHLSEFDQDMRMRAFLAALYVQVNDSKNGIRLAEELVSLGPTRPLFYLILGEAYLDAERYDEALEAFERAYVLAPDNPQAQEGFAIGYIRAGEIEDARAFMQEHFGTAQPPLVRIIRAFIEQDLVEDAILGAEKLVEQEPQELRWRLSLAQLYLRVYRDADAIEQLQSIADIEPGLSGQMDTLIGQIRDGTINRNF